jgi:ANTAR domain-containing protein/GAF domain-containing protein
MSPDRLVDTAQRLASSLTPGDLDHTLERITAAAVEILPGVHYSGITMKHRDGRLETVAQTDDLLLGVDAAQYELQEGPCYLAAVHDEYVASSYLAADPRFRRYSVTAVKAGVNAQAAVRLFETPQGVHGALNFYSRDVGSFSDMSTVGQLFAHQAALALSYAHEVENLQEAVKTRQLIGKAVGIAMERFGLSAERAFAFLARLSQTDNTKLRDVASELVDQTEQSPGVASID